jgi:methylmalonyl-CoA mutase cobalamin-binding domain/chain
MPQELAEALVELQRDTVLSAVKSRAASGEDPRQILEECRQGMTMVGERFHRGDYFLAELILSGETFKEAMTILKPYLVRARPSAPLAKVVLATMKGDIHDLGKNILSVLLEAQGFEIFDLGVDVAPVRLVEKVKDVKPDFVGFSALITTTFPSMKEAAELLEEAGLRDQVKLMIGGGVTSPKVKEYVGADFHTLDAAEGVAYCLQTIGGK